MSSHSRWSHMEAGIILKITMKFDNLCTEQFWSSLQLSSGVSNKSCPILICRRSLGEMTLNPPLNSDSHWDIS